MECCRLFVILFSFFLFVSMLQWGYVIEGGAYVDVFVYIDDSGVAHVYTKLVIPSAGLQEVYLPIPPVIASIDVYVNGKEVAFIVCNESGYVLCIPVESALSTVEIRYIANISIIQNAFSLIIKPYSNVTLTVAPNVILLSLPPNLLQEPILIGGNMTMKFTVTETYILRYIVRETGIESTPKTVQTVSTTQIGIELVVIPIALVGFSSFVLLYVWRRRREVGVKRNILQELGDVDLMIVKVLEKMGGSALQSELQREIPVPRTTLWRHIRKLEKLGIVRVEKVGIQNRVILQKRVHP